MISQSCESKTIDEATYNYLSCNNGLCNKAYFSPKIQRKIRPLRPIVPLIRSPLYNWTKFLSNLLAYASEKNGKYSKNSSGLIDYIKSITLPENYILIFLDVTSLYTNISINLAAEIVVMAFIWTKILDEKCDVLVAEQIEYLFGKVEMRVGFPSRTYNFFVPI